MENNIEIRQSLLQIIKLATKIYFGKFLQILKVLLLFCAPALFLVYHISRILPQVFDVENLTITNQSGVNTIFAALIVAVFLLQISVVAISSYINDLIKNNVDDMEKSLLSTIKKVPHLIYLNLIFFMSMIIFSLFFAASTFNQNNLAGLTTIVTIGIAILLSFTFIIIGISDLKGFQSIKFSVLFVAKAPVKNILWLIIMRLSSMILSLFVFLFFAGLTLVIERFVSIDKFENALLFVGNALAFALHYMFFVIMKIVWFAGETVAVKPNDIINPAES